MLRILAAAATLGLGATLVLAQNGQAIKERQELMDGVAKALVELGKMAKGKAPFDLAKVQAGLQRVETELPKLKNLFPDDSKTGETDARPKIWQNKAAFHAAIEKAVSDVKAAGGRIKDEASLQSEYANVGRACGNCHGDAGFAPSLKESFKRMNQ
jgi:cytochrome c556